MKQFLTFVKKEFYHIFRDRRTMLILLGMPIIQIILFGFALTNEVKEAQIAILNPSHDVTSQKIINSLEESEYFTIAKNLHNANEIQTEFQKGKIGMVVCFEDNFSQHLHHNNLAKIQLVVDSSDPNTGTTLVNYASAIIYNFQRQQSSDLQIPFQINTESKLLYNPQMKGAYNFVPGVLGMILMLICAMMTSIAIVREKEMGTMEVLLVSPMKPIYIILAKAVPYFVLSSVNMASVLLLSVFVLKLPIAGSLLLLIAVSLLFIMVSLSLGLLVSTLTQTQVAAMLVSSMVFIMPVMLLSGMIYPVENMPLPLRIISNIVPAKWYIFIVKNIMIKGAGLFSVIKVIAILCFMAVLIIAVSLRNFKNRLE